MSRPLPRINRDSAPYWRSAKEHDLELQRCSSCERFRFYPSLSCTFCQSLEAEWVPISGRAEVYTYSVVHRAPGAPFADLLPLIVAMVELEEGPAMMTNLVDVDPAEVRIGMPVELAYEDVDDEVTLPVFRPSR